MTPEDIAIKLTACEGNIDRLTGRVKSLEGDTRALNKLATSVELLAQSQADMKTSMQGLSTKVENLESEPGKRWKSLVALLGSVVVTAAVTYMLAKIGI